MTSIYRLYCRPILGFVLFGLLAACARDSQDSMDTSSDGARASGKAEVRELVIVSYGGAYQEAQRKALFEPFAEAFGVTIHEESWSGDFETLRTMVESGDVSWDVVAVEGYMVNSGAEENLYEKIDYSKVPKAELLPQAVHDYGVATCFWSTTLGYNTHAYGAIEDAPAGWGDLWNVEAFKGPRTLRQHPVGNLEIALLADGVPPGEIYPIDIERAFASMDRIKPHVDVWWEAGQEPADLLGDGEIHLGSVWNGRVHNAAELGEPVDNVWEGAIISSDWWTIPRGAKHADLAQAFIAFASSSIPQSNYPRYIPYGPVNKEAIKLLDDDILRELPTGPENLARGVMTDNQWWSDHQEAVLEKWEAWLGQ